MKDNILAAREIWLLFWFYSLAIKIVTFKKDNQLLYSKSNFPFAKLL